MSGIVIKHNWLRISGILLVILSAGAGAAPILLNLGNAYVFEPIMAVGFTLFVFSDRRIIPTIFSWIRNKFFHLAILCFILVIAALIGYGTHGDIVWVYTDLRAVSILLGTFFVTLVLLDNNLISYRELAIYSVVCLALDLFLALIFFGTVLKFSSNVPLVFASCFSSVVAGSWFLWACASAMGITVCAVSAYRGRIFLAAVSSLLSGGLLISQKFRIIYYMIIAGFGIVGVYLIFNLLDVTYYVNSKFNLDSHQYHQLIYKTEQLYYGIFYGRAFGISEASRYMLLEDIIMNFDEYMLPSGLGSKAVGGAIVDSAIFGIVYLFGYIFGGVFLIVIIIMLGRRFWRSLLSMQGCVAVLYFLYTGGALVMVPQALWCGIWLACVVGWDARLTPRPAASMAYKFDGSRKYACN